MRPIGHIALAMAMSLAAAPAAAQGPSSPASSKAAEADDLQAAIAKTNAYIGLMNRTLRASESGTAT